MKLVVILSRVPYPLEKGDKLRAFHQLKELSKRHEIVLCCLNDGKKPSPETLEVLRSIASETHIFQLNKIRIFANLLFGLLSSKPFQVLYFYQRKAHKQIASIIEQANPDRIFCQLIRTAEYAKNEHDYYKILDYQDAFSKGVDRREKKAKWPWREIFAMERKRLIAYENIIFEYFEAKVIISEEDRRFIYHPERKDIKIVTNGIDTEFFAKRGKEPAYDLVFTGNMSYPPNIETAEFIVNQVLPALKKQRPGISVLLSGSTPHKRVQALDAIEGVTVSGWVDDIRDSYESARVFFAPMQIGTGLQNKLLEAMSLQIPAVTSELANKSLKGKDGENILIRNSVEGYVEAIESLLQNPEMATKIGTKGREYVEKNFSWKQSVDVLESTF